MMLAALLLQCYDNSDKTKKSLLHDQGAQNDFEAMEEAKFT